MAITSTLGTNRFGIKEVADVHFFDVTSASAVSAEATLNAFKDSTAKLSFNTLKVSTIESTAENSEARGGKGNAALISWDYGREITVNIEDALLSMETLALLFENDTNPESVTNGKMVVINANKFPGTYAVVGTTYARDELTGKDHVFKFVIPKAKIQSETTLTMEADGDPTVIGMTLKVLRAGNGDMLALIRDDNPVGEDTVEYSATLYYASGKVETWVGGSDNEITLPTKTSGYKWVVKGTTTEVSSKQTLTANTVFEEVSDS